MLIIPELTQGCNERWLETPMDIQAFLKALRIFAAMPGY